MASSTSSTPSLFRKEHSTRGWRLEPPAPARSVHSLLSDPVSSDNYASLIAAFVRLLACGPPGLERGEDSLTQAMGEGPKGLVPYPCAAGFASRRRVCRRFRALEARQGGLPATSNLPRAQPRHPVPRLRPSCGRTRANRSRRGSSGRHSARGRGCRSRCRCRR